jgi:hypothetical protein
MMDAVADRVVSPSMMVARDDDSASMGRALDNATR